MTEIRGRNFERKNIKPKKDGRLLSDVERPFRTKQRSCNLNLGAGRDSEKKGKITGQKKSAQLGFLNVGSAVPIEPTNGHRGEHEKNVWALQKRSAA